MKPLDPAKPLPAEPRTTRPAASISMLIADSRGANLVEYIILVGVIALIAIAGFKVFGNKVREKVDDQSDAVGGINGSAK